MHRRRRRGEFLQSELDATTGKPGRARQTRALAVNRLPCFDSAQLEGVCKVLADTSRGLTGGEIGHLLAQISLPDPTPGLTKWKRLFNALAQAQNKHQVGNHLVMLVNRAMTPVRYVSQPDLFEQRRDDLNVVLAFSGYRVREDGQVVKTTRESTLAGARQRASTLKSILEARHAHAEVFKYCRAELLEENYFHAVLEAVKGVAQRLRDLSGATTDGAELVAAVLSTKAPVLKLNSLQTETELSEQKGIANLMVGLFGAVRNPTAHAPKILWPLPENDALDILALVSFLHRKLDGATKV